MSEKKLIVLRGNSGSGKSTTAKILQERAREKTAHVEQDYLRRHILREKDLPEGVNQGLIFQVVKYCLESQYHVVLEGILSTLRNAELIKNLVEIHPTNNYFFYFDVPFEETLKRHATKHNSHEFGEAEMRQWWREHDVLGYKNEVIIPGDLSQDQIVEKILEVTDL